MMIPPPAPSLSSVTDYYPSSTTLSTSSVDTGLASDLARHDILEDDGNGVLVVPQPQSPSESQSFIQTPAPRISNTRPIFYSSRAYYDSDDYDNATNNYNYNYACLFHVLNCHETFTDIDHWKTHVLSHFRTHQPPPIARCPICPTITSLTSPTTNTPNNIFTDTSHIRAWDALLDHIDTAHYQHGHTLVNTRPDFELLRYLFRLRIISEEQFKLVQVVPGAGSPGYQRGMEPARARVGSAEEPFCAAYSRRRERRMTEERRRGWGVA
ncbi:uncharacterized protein EURHEDRAFT_495298 [Aspergillus ruber CBS 135680]|uniref:Uncharacterized protein n=1 Tax=Aspergillus ruber (strain CBS 135680) TaxID=1388766 RepID=A0A017SLK5_ASPRC|nr:uncharacterized protein EURHEDRAFT_495298 [Aspergillus ruber CBS 135680]EYE97641.1 hypothetical protein EURHEDRAFT_495298 [Aspergillus ruber CBS 135680]